MKICPKCNAQYDSEMSFCLQDGTLLTLGNTSSEPTLAINDSALGEKTLTLPNQTETLKFKQTDETEIATKVAIPPMPTNEPKFETFDNAPPSRSGLIIAAVLGILALFGIGIGGLVFLNPFGKNETVALSNSNSATSNQSNNLSNTNISNLSVNSGSNSTLPINANIKSTPTVSPTLSNTKATPKPTETAETTPTPKPTATSTPTMTSTPTPTPTPIATPIPRPTRPTPKVVSGGVLNGKAINLVKPPYPPVAKAVRASGAVVVQVTVDENGNVISASAVSGHALLRASAESAARASKFSPTSIGGQPVKVSGVIVYNFTAQ